MSDKAIPFFLARPTPQTARPHSCLDAEKLTASPLLSTPRSGWTQPNSVTPSAPSPGNAPGQPKTTPLVITVGGHGPAQDDSPASMRDSSRSKPLFNERSNRMEPFSEKQHVPAPPVSPHIAPPRTSQDSSRRFNDNRPERDAPPHANLTHDEGQGSFRTRDGPTVFLP